MALSGPVLIGFAGALAAPEAASSLLSADLPVAAFAAGSSRSALHSDRRVGIVEITPPQQDAGVAARELVAAARALGAVALMPLDDGAVWLCDRVAGEAGLPVIGPTGPQARLALDKTQQVAAARRAGLPVLPTRILDTPAGVLALDEFPAILKPGLATHERGGRLHRGAGRVCANAAELAAVADDFADGGPILVQPWVRGIGEGLFGIVVDGEIVHASAHRRLRMLNPQGSGSSACRSIDPDPELVEAGGRMLRDAGWSGLFMLEFLRDDDGTPWFVELNGRAWGSLALARRLGLEYPAWAAREALGLGAPPARVPGRTDPVVCRHLGREMLHVVSVLRGPRSAALADWPSRWGTIRAVARVQRDDRWYNWSPDRPSVFVNDTLQTLLDPVRNVLPSSTLRIAAHVHSTWSYDGEWELAELAAAFGRRGYDAVLMCEHDRTFDARRWAAFVAACAEASAAGAVLVPGIEYSDAANRVHVPVWGVDDFLGTNRATGDLLEEVRAAGGVSVLAHPNRREAWRVFQPRWLELAHAVETWNRKTDGWAPSAAALRVGAEAPQLWPFVGLDFHSARQFFPLAMVAPGAKRPSLDAILALLRGGALRPAAFGRPAAAFSGGRGLDAVRACEGVRRPLARAYRRARTASARR